MGWTGYYATNYKNGKIDRKAECREILTRYGAYEILKDSMSGSVYYAAIRQLKECIYKDGNFYYEPIESERVFAIVILTRISGRQFIYKDMSETMEPFYYDCPASILNLLSETDNKCALQWRENCRKRIEANKNPNTLSNLKIGAKIKFILNDKEFTAVKVAACYQYKRPFWYVPSEHAHVSTRHIPQNYEVLAV